MGETIASGIRDGLHSQNALEDPALFAGQRVFVADIASCKASHEDILSPQKQMQPECAIPGHRGSRILILLTLDSESYGS